MVLNVAVLHADDKYSATVFELSKPEAKFESSTCRTATFGPIPGLQKT
jgi:hypothetical protein